MNLEVGSKAPGPASSAGSASPCNRWRGASGLKLGFRVYGLGFQGRGLEKLVRGGLHYPQEVACSLQRTQVELR